MPSKPTDTTPPADDWRDATGELRAVSAQVARLAARDAKRGTRAYLSRWRADAPGHVVTLAVGVVVAALVFAVAMTRASADTTGAERAAAATRLFSGVATQDAAGIGASTATPEARAGEAPAWAAGLPAGVARWAGEIEAAAQRHGVPARLVACMMGQESGGQVAVPSPAGALGLMQLMPDTARGLGLTVVDGGQDERLDPHKNLDAGVRYIGQHLATYGGDVALALVAYNGGGGAVARYQQGAAYTESRNYLAAILPCYERGA